MEKKQNPALDFNFTLIADFFRVLDRQGPGSVEETLRALAFVPDTQGLRIADIGCGTGGQTATIALHRDCTVTGLDLLPELLEEFDARMHLESLDGRVGSLLGSMDALPFAPGELDVIWAEGSIYNIGFERGLREWRRYLKPGGIIAVTECSWLTGQRIDDGGFLGKYHPELAGIPEKLKTLEEVGYAPVAHFALPPTCWIDNYHVKVAERIPAFLERHGYSEAALAMTAVFDEEILHYRKYGKYYGYVFYIGRKIGE